MMNRLTLSKILLLGVVITATSMLSACSSSGSGYSGSRVHYSAGYRGYYGRPWGYGPGYVDVVDPGWDDMPTQLPAMGMPDMGGYDW